MKDIKKSDINKADYEFTRFLKSYKKKKDTTSFYPIDWDNLSADDFKEIYKASYKKLRQVLKPILLNEADDKDILFLLSQLMTLIPSYYVGYPLRQEIVLKNLRQEVHFQETDHDKFWILPHDIFLSWLAACHKGKLGYNLSKVFLAWLWALESRPTSTKSRIRILKIDIQRLSGHGDKLVGDSLQELKGLGLIDFIIEDDKYMARPVPITPSDYDLLGIPSSIPLISEIDIDYRLEELQMFEYLFKQPLNIHNPYLFSDVTRFRMHDRMLNMEFFLVSVLSRDEVNRLLRLAHHTSGIARTITTIKDRVRKFFGGITNLKTPSLDPHYKLLYDLTPTVHYVCRRKFEVNKESLTNLQHYYKYRILTAENHFYDAYNVLDLDFTHLYKCLKSNLPDEMWEEKYNFDDFKLLPSKLKKKMSVLEDDELDQIKKINISPDFDLASLCETPEGMSFDNSTLKRLSKEGWFAVYCLVDIKQYSQALSELGRISKNLNSDNTLSITSVPNFIDNSTHRLVFSGISTQNIRKLNRPIIEARDGYQFLMVDIVQQELNIIKWYTHQYQGSNPDTRFQDLTFETIARDLNIERDTAKSLFLKHTYGAGKDLLIDELKISSNLAEQFQKYMRSFSDLEILKKEVTAFAKQNGVTPETSLKHQFPVFRLYKALSVLIQGTAAEVTHTWLNELSKHDLLPFVVNVIYDELLLEVPSDRNLYDISEIISQSLSITIQKLLPSCSLDTKFTTNKVWDKTQASTLYLQPQNTQ